MVVWTTIRAAEREQEKERERERELRRQVDWARGSGNYLSSTGCSLHICLAEPGAVVPLRRVWARLRILIHDLACLVFMLCSVSFLCYSCSFDV